MQSIPLSDRQNEIVNAARIVGRVTVDDLAIQFNVTPQTIRKDLNDLCERRVLKRTHGGAIIASSIENMAYEARRFMVPLEKQAIGIAAAAQIPNRSSLFINIGTTTEEVAYALKDHEHLLIITNNLNVAISFRKHPSIEVIVVGGQVRRSDGAVVGGVAVEMIRRFKVDTAVIGASAIEEDGSLLDFDMQEVHVARAIIENARRVLLACDQTKLQRTAPVRIAHISEIHTFVTDQLTSPRLRQICATHGVQVIEASLPQPGGEAGLSSPG